MAGLTWIRTAALCVFVGTGACALSGCGEDAYDLRGPSFTEGERIRQDIHTSMDNGTLTVAFDGDSMNVPMSMEFWSAIEYELLEFNDGQLSRARLHIEHEVEQYTMSMMGQQDTDTTRSPLEGKTALATKIGNNWSLALESGEADDATQEALDAIARQFNEGIVMAPNVYPDAPVRVGHTWDAPRGVIADFFGGEVINPSGSLTLEFVRIVERDGEECAEIRGEFELSGKMDMDDALLDVAFSGSGTIYRSLETFADILSSWNGTMSASGEVVEEGMRMNMSIRGPMSITTTEGRTR